MECGSSSGLGKGDWRSSRNGFFAKVPLMPDSPARLTVTQQKDVAIVEFTDSKILDEMNINEIGQALTALVETKDRSKLLLDFANVDHLSSAALGMLITVNNKIKQQNGQLRLANIKPQIMEVFVITKLNRLFRIAATRLEAIATFT
jgi:anti-sigma B factor antagonist